MDYLCRTIGTQIYEKYLNFPNFHPTIFRAILVLPSIPLKITHALPKRELISWIFFIGGEAGYERIIGWEWLLSMVNNGCGVW